MGGRFSPEGRCLVTAGFCDHAPNDVDWLKRQRIQRACKTIKPSKTSRKMITEMGKRKEHIIHWWIHGGRNES